VKAACGVFEKFVWQEYTQFRSRFSVRWWTDFQADFIPSGPKMLSWVPESGWRTERIVSGAFFILRSNFNSPIHGLMEKQFGGMTSRPSKTGASHCPFLGRTVGARLSWVRTSVAGIAIVAICGIASLASAQNRMSEYDVKAAYLFNFGKFVRFTPPDADSKRQIFDICIVGDDPLGATLDRLAANELFDGKPVRVLRLKTAVEARGCAIAYISASEGARVKNDLDALRGQPVLTVSDAGNFLQNGGMVQFVPQENHVRFAVDLDAVRNARLSLSSELLRVAISVNGEPPVGVRP
jgi:hypothetical protein